MVIADHQRVTVQVGRIAACGGLEPAAVDRDRAVAAVDRQAQVCEGQAAALHQQVAGRGDTDKIRVGFGVYAARLVHAVADDQGRDAAGVAADIDARAGIGGGESQPPVPAGKNIRAALQFQRRRGGARDRTVKDHGAPAGPAPVAGRGDRQRAGKGQRASGRHVRAHRTAHRHRRLKGEIPGGSGQIDVRRGTAVQGQQGAAAHRDRTAGIQDFDAVPRGRGIQRRRVRRIDRVVPDRHVGGPGRDTANPRRTCVERVSVVLFHDLAGAQRQPSGDHGTHCRCELAFHGLSPVNEDYKKSILE